MFLFPWAVARYGSGVATYPTQAIARSSAGVYERELTNMMKYSLRAVLTTAVAAAGIVLASAGDVHAAPFTFSCPSGADCHGATYGIKLTDVTSLGGGLFEYEVTFGIDTTGYSGDPGDSVHAVSFKALVSGFTDLALTSHPGGVGTWNPVSKGLQADGCKIAGEIAACAESSGFGAPVSPADELFWVFTFKSSDATPGPIAHIKFLYVEDALDRFGDFKKVGGLGGFEIPLQGPDSPTVPEPATMALFGIALAASAGQYRRRRR